MIERRRAELRAAPGRRIIGAAMRYGSEAIVRGPDGAAVRERFAAFAFADYLRSGAATRLNLMHDSSVVIASTAGGAGRGLLTLRDNPDALTIEARLPSGDAFDEALALVADGSTAQTSIEFRALEQTVAGDLRIVRQATLPGIGIVDTGAYGTAGAVEVRRRGPVVTMRVPYDVKLACECSGPNCSFAVFEPGSLADLADEVLAVAGEYSAPLASRSRGTLRLDPDDAGLAIALDLPDNEAGRAVLEAAAVAAILARPYLDRRLSVSTEDGDTRRYQRAAVRAIVVGATDKLEGWTEAEIGERRNHRARERVRAERASRGRRIWL